MTSSPTLLIRDAVASDLPAIVAMLADDMLGRAREAGRVDTVYGRALAAIEADPNNRQLVAIRTARSSAASSSPSSRASGVTAAGAPRSNRCASTPPGAGGGIGAAMMAWAIERARERGCVLVQLTTDKRRDDAHRFYRRLGFVATHEGMKLTLA